MTSHINRIAWKLIYFLGNLKLAIVLLLFIAFVSSLGTIIEQEKTISFYETNYPISYSEQQFVIQEIHKVIFIINVNNFSHNNKYFKVSKYSRT